MNWIYYLLEANLYLTIFYALYYLTLKNETYYQLNRVYLLFTSALSFLIPFLQLGFLKPTYITTAPVITQFQRPIMITLTPPVQNPGWDIADYLLCAYVVISCVFVIQLFIKIYALIRLSNKNKTIVNKAYRLIEIEKGGNAFSFFNYLFISGDQSQKQIVINHELIHIQQKHSWDILYLQLLKIVNWFNPVVYLLQYSIKEQHEFIADRETSMREENASAYASFLLSNAYGLDESSLANTFFNKSLLKKRIIMLHQKPSGNLARLKYLAALPVCVGLLCASTLAFSKTYGWIDLAPKPKPKNDSTNVKKTEHNSVYVNTNEFTNSKGYKIEEKTTDNNGHWSQKATITGKDGNIHIFYNEKISDADRKMLMETYGYKFPKIKITNVVLAPPPPIHSPKIPPPPIDSRSAPKAGNDNAPNGNNPNEDAPPPPPPPAPPGNASDKIAAPQSPTEEIKMNYDDTLGAISKEKMAKTINQLMVVNGTKYRLKAKLRPNEHVYISGQNSAAVYSPGDLYAKSKWGIDADSGVVVLSGKPMVTIK